MYSVNKTPQRASMNEAQTRNGTRTAASGSTGASSTKSSAARTSKRKAEAEERTRDRVLREVLNNGPVSAATLGELLSLTPAAVRRHLDALESNNMIEVAPIKKHGAGAGRPARRYVIAPQGHERLGNDYLIIARNALQMLRDTVGQEALEAFASARAADMEARYRPVVEAAGDDVAARRGNEQGRFCGDRSGHRASCRADRSRAFSGKYSALSGSLPGTRPRWRLPSVLRAGNRDYF